MASAGARAYSGGLGACPRVQGVRAKPPKADDILQYERVIFTINY